MNPEDIKYVNCADCGRELLGESMLAWWETLTWQERRKYLLVADRIGGRPYCLSCGMHRRWAKPE